MGKTLQYPFPELKYSENDMKTPEGLERFARLLIRNMKDRHIELINVINFNNISFVSQNDVPTLENGEVKLWKDADATSGNPTHYLVAKDSNGDQVTFASEETVP